MNLDDLELRSDRSWSQQGSQKGPLFRRPELLTHPNIPRPLHGVAPRVVMGRKWWDEKRKHAYEVNDFHCWACGVHKAQALGRSNILEAHEAYSIDWARGIVRLHEIVALCHYCHNFIHSGRLWSLQKRREIPPSQFQAIMQHGFDVVVGAGLSPWWGTLMNWLQFCQRLPDWGAFDQVSHLVPESEYVQALWPDWRLIIDGQAFGPKHEDIGAWREHYGEETSVAEYAPVQASARRRSLDEDLG